MRYAVMIENLEDEIGKPQVISKHHGEVCAERACEELEAKYPNAAIWVVPIIKLSGFNGDEGL